MCTHALNEKSSIEGFYATDINQNNKGRQSTFVLTALESHCSYSAENKEKVWHDKRGTQNVEQEVLKK